VNSLAVVSAAVPAVEFVGVAAAKGLLVGIDAAPDGPAEAVPMRAASVGGSNAAGVAASGGELLVVGWPAGVAGNAASNPVDVAWPVEPAAVAVIGFDAAEFDAP
jgi:hypothetical protein